MNSLLFRRLIAVSFFLAGSAGLSSAAFPGLYLRPVVLQQFHSPTNILGVPDGSGRLFVTDQPGLIYFVRAGMMVPVPFLDISATAPAADRKVIPLDTGYSERGLLGMAFHPGFANPDSPGYRKFYLNYSKPYDAATDPAPPVADHTPNHVTVIAEFQVSAGNPDVAEPASERRLMTFTQPQSNHNGGQLAFGPDNMLYIGSGDGGSADDNNVGHTGGATGNPRPTSGLGNGQDKTTFLGKILRIDPMDPDGAGPLTYGIPVDNPLVNDSNPPGLKKEIYAFGLRNPWRFSFDTRTGGTGRLFCCDVGQIRIEEVNLIVPGGNYGWRYREGHELPSFSSGAANNPMPDPGGPMIDPIAVYAHPGISGSSLPQLGLSGTGGFVYRGSAIPALQGKYVFGDYGSTSGSPSGRLMGLEETAPLSGVFTLTEALPLVGGNPIALRVLCLGEDADGELYVGTKVTGGVMALVDGLPNGGLYKLVAAPTAPALLTYSPNRDATIVSEAGAGGEELANGAGPLVAGTSASGDLRRALVSFDLSVLPTSTRLQSAWLEMSVTGVDAANPGSRTFHLQRLEGAWGEGPSTGGAAAANDVTWINRVFSEAPVPWTNAGGDFDPTDSAIIPLNGPGSYSWQSVRMVQEVNGWVTSPTSSQGWLIRSDETDASTAKQIGSRESAEELRPRLTLVPAGPWESWVLTWFPELRTGEFLDATGDPDGDSWGNQVEYATGGRPKEADDAVRMSIQVVPGPLGSVVTMTFRRDAAATDTTIRLQATGDPGSWTTLATSAAGGPPVAENGAEVVSDEVLTGSTRLVTVRQTLGIGANRTFVRLSVDRSF